MVDDAIAELLNMVAAQISNALGSKHQLGLPSRTTLPEIAAGGGLRLDDAALMHSEGAIDLGLWILEGPAPSDKKAEAAGGFRSLLRKIRRRPLTSGPPLTGCSSRRPRRAAARTTRRTPAARACRSPSTSRPRARA